MSTSRTAARLACAVTLLCGGTGLAAARADASPATTGAVMTPTVLAPDIVHGLSALEAADPTTATPGSTPLTLGVTVADPDPAAVTALIDSANTPGSADYRDFPTPAEFAADYGPAPATVTAVAAWLTSGGLTVTTHATTPGYLSATGTVSQVGALMDTSFVSFTSLHFLANTVAPTVPAAVLDVAGLNTGAVPRIADPDHKTNADSPPTGLLSPNDLWDIYDQPASDEGQGQSMALFGEGTVDFGGGDTVESYMRQFEAEYSLPQIPYSVKYFESSAADTPTDTSGEGEWVLDAQAADGMAPDADALVDYFGAALTDADSIGSYLEWANDANGPLQGSTSYGSCEEVPDTDTVTGTTGGVTYLGNPDQDAYEQTFAQIAAEGRTLFSASGDTAQGCGLATDVNGVTPDPLPVQNYPGISPNVVGVGGSVLYFNGETTTAGVTTPASRVEEYPWPYSSGGRSYFEPANSFQAAALQPVSAAGTAAGNGLPVDPYTNYVDADGNAHPAGFAARIQPDVAALSGDVTGNGYTICDSGGCDDFGAGTSLSSPLWLGMWTRVQALEPADAKGDYDGLGFAEATIYRLAKAATYTQAYYDLGSASETPPSVSTTNGSSVPAEGGYDTQTGWGVLDVAKFATLATGSTTFVPVDPGGPTTAPPALPEAPFAVALPVLGVLSLGAVVWFRRRRVHA
jgi:subtilase family serine protease